MLNSEISRMAIQNLIQPNKRFNEADRMIDIINHKEKYADELFK